jgi:hypothetical protein
VRCWFAPHDLPIGAKTWEAIDAAIQIRDKVVLILSKNAIASDWVEDEIGKAFAEERRRNQIVLFPVRIDETVMKDLRAVGGEAPRPAEHRRLPPMETPRRLPAGVRSGPARPEGGAWVTLPGLSVTPLPWAIFACPGKSETPANAIERGLLAL